VELKSLLLSSILNANCPVCSSRVSRDFVTTKALMHKANDEKFYFNLCENCDTVFLTNPVAPAELESYYTENYLPYKGADAWGRFSNFVEKSQKKLDLKRVKLVQKFLKQKQKSVHILDVGCGNPSFLDLVEKKLQFTCTGIDFSDAGWRGKEFNNLTLVNTSIEDFEADQLFDVITLWHFLEHDYDPPKTIAKLHNFLKPGGKIVIEVPDYVSISRRRQHENWQGWHSPRHLSLFSEKSFSVLFDQEKWIIKKHLRYGTLDAFTLWWLGKMEKKGISWSGNMEPEFWPLVGLKVLTFPFFIFEKLVPFGIQILVVEKK